MGAAAGIIEAWPQESREAAQLVLDEHGEPAESTASFLAWNDIGPWKRIVASKDFFEHNFPAPHIDSVESVIAYDIEPEMVSPLSAFDGSVIVDRTAGQVSARCHDIEANRLALNLMYDIVTGEKGVAEARSYYAKEFLDYRRGLPTPYMEQLHFSPIESSGAPDERVLSDEDLERAQSEGEGKSAT